MLADGAGSRSSRYASVRGSLQGFQPTDKAYFLRAGGRLASCWFPLPAAHFCTDPALRSWSLAQEYPKFLFYAEDEQISFLKIFNSKFVTKNTNFLKSLDARNAIGARSGGHGPAQTN